MGFFSKFRKKDEIELPSKNRESIIHPLSSNMTKINIGEHLNVEEGWNAIIVAKEKPLEIFSSGQHELTVNTLPNTTKALNLSRGRVKKTAKTVEVIMPDSFMCDMYYINLQKHTDFPWHTGKLYLRSKRYGLYKVNLEGVLDLQVVKAKDFLKMFLYNWSHIPLGCGDKYLSSLINEECREILIKSPFSDPNDLLDSDKMGAYLLEHLCKTFEKYGLSFDAVRVNNSNLSGKVANVINFEKSIEQNGNSGLQQKVEEQIDNLNTGNNAASSATEGLQSTNTLPPDSNNTSANVNQMFDANQSPMNMANNVMVGGDTRVVSSEVGQISNTPISNTSQMQVTNDFSNAGTQAVYPSQNVNSQTNVGICPKCGSPLVGGLCMNCEREKDKNQ